MIAFLLLSGSFMAFADQQDSGREEQEEQTDSDQSTPPPEVSKELLERIDQLEDRIEQLENQNEQMDQYVRSLDWEPDRDFFSLPNGWYISFNGEFRGRAIIEANTVNAYTNSAGERIYAYDPRSTLKNDYGWWDQRLQARALFNFGTHADLIMLIQVGDSAWGSRAPLWGDAGENKFDHVTIQFRELWARFSLDPIQLFLDFGRMPWELGNRLIQGNEHDGARFYYRHPYFEMGFGAFRQYEGENYEMKMKTNDDEDTFVFWTDIKPKSDQKLSLWGWLDDLKVTEEPTKIDEESPLLRIPDFEQKLYEGQESQLYDLGANYVGKFNDVTINLEYNHQFGTLFANSSEDASDIHFHGFGGIAKLDFLIEGTEYLVWTSGYGSGDDPNTPDYEGFFGPDNDFGIKEETMHEQRDRGYFAVYEHLSPGAGVPGRLRDDLGTGGIENTIFTNLGWDSNFHLNHHYFLSLGYIQAARKNPETNSSIIGLEVDARMDYIFSENLSFSIYGGHLFIIGDYFRKNAHDAAQLVFEWKLQW